MLYALHAWGDEHAAPGPDRRRLFVHVPCGTELDARAACASCGTVPSPAEVEMRPGPALVAEPEPEEFVSRTLRRARRLLDPMR